MAFKKNKILVSLWFVVVTCFLLLSTVARSADDQLRINMDNGDVRNFIQWVAQETGRTFVIDPRVKGKVNIVSNGTLKRSDIWSLFLSVLQLQGFEVVEGGGNWQIVPNALARSSGLPLVDNAQGRELVIRVLQPENVSVIQLVPLLRPLVAQNGHMAAFPDSNALIVADHARSIKTIEALIDRIDQADDFEIELVKLRHANARSVVDIVKALVVGDGPEGAPARKLIMAADERSNSILLAGDVGKRKAVRRAIDQLDRLEQAEDNTEVVYLHYLKASEAAPILQKLTGSLQKLDKSSSTQKADITIQASETTNALVINAPSEMMATLGRVIKKLDIRRAQVLVEAVIIEISDNQVDQLGVQWGTTASPINGDGWFGGTRSGSIDIGSLDGFPGADGNIALGSGLSLGFYRNGSLRALVRALASDDKANILSTPNLVTLDNEEANIIVGQNLPFITGRSTSSSSDTTNPFQTIERRDVGLKLTIKPQINEGNAVTLDVNQEISSVTEVTGASDLATNTRSLKTRVLIEDGDTLVLGGLISDEDSNSVEKIPLLGDIPFLGKLFINTKSSRVKRNLMVFLRPTIIKDRALAYELSQQRYQFLRNQSPLYGDSVDDLISVATGQSLLTETQSKVIQNDALMKE